MRNARSQANATALRKRMTDAENCLWTHLRRRQLAGCKFRRQAPIGKYIVDFVCLEKRIVVELDGGQHADRLVEDGGRTQFLVDQGYQVLRFWNDEVLMETKAVLEVILDALGPLSKAHYAPHRAAQPSQAGDAK